MLELYNAILAENSPEQLDVQIDALSLELQEMGEALQSDVDMTFEEMLQTEAAYAKSEHSINELLRARDTLSTYAPADVGQDSASLQLSYDQLMAEIEEAGVYDDIGELGFWPAIGVKHKVNSSFGSRWDPVTNKSYSYHEGLDIYSPMGTPVGAMWSGTVYRTGVSTGSGNYIYIDHGYGVKSFYCHLSEILVTKGQNVKQSDIIAKSGNTGTRTTGPHLHVGVYIDGVAVDPKVVLPDGS